MTFKNKLANILNNYLLRHAGAALVPLATTQQIVRQASSPNLENPVSQLVSGDQIRSPHFQKWLVKLGMKPGLNRKLWEYVYILRALEYHLDFANAPKILGFGVGRERIPAVLASMGCHVLATDLPCDEPADADDWTARSLHDLLEPLAEDWDPDLRSKGLCPPELFNRMVTFQSVDMNNIAENITGFDALWSCGSFEHIGGLQAGLDFVTASLACLKPGGIAVHTTEFNISSDKYTYDSPDLSFYRKSDLLNLSAKLQQAGHEITFNFHRENTPENNHIDQPPFNYDCTINARQGVFVITSVGIIIKKNMEL